MNIYLVPPSFPLCSVHSLTSSWPQPDKISSHYSCQCWDIHTNNKQSKTVAETGKLEATDINYFLVNTYLG